MIVLHIHEKSNIDILPLWINFYKNNNISFIIHTKLQLDIDIKLCSSNDDYLNKEKHIVITEYDYLFSYKKGENDVMLLSNDITGIENEKSIIGKVFYVPVQDKKEYTTFEIPDFIIYKHDNHTNYTKDGIIINNGNIPSNNFVCFSLEVSKVAMETEYYENDILFDISNPDNVYIEYEYNIFVNKEKKYGIIWHYKCACSTITNYFGKINNLNKITHGLVIDNLKYRYNNYLQGFDIISFVRHPFFRFISCYFNKHINKLDNYYHLENETYLNYLNIYKDDTLFNFADYLQNNNIIDEHSICISKMNYFNKYKNLNYNIVHIEDINLNEYLFNFFSKYHVIEKLKIFLNVSHSDTSIVNINKEYKFYNYNDWINYLKIEKVIPNYICILDDEFIKKLNIIYNDDLVILNYNNKLLKNTNVNNNINENLPDDFDVSMYKELNPNMSTLTDIEAKAHYIQHGRFEGRLYKIENLPDDFNVNMYKELNYELQSLTDNQANAHYIQHGRFEGKLYKIENLPDDFNVSMYKELNPNMSTLTDIEAKAHYIQYGRFEGRLYKIENIPNDFDVSVYKELNPDISTLTDNQAKSHYIQYGKNEGRLYKIENIPNDFDVNMYKEINYGLDTLTDIEAKAHYIQYGKNEGKLYKIENLPDDFDVNIYKKLNPDLETLNDNQLKLHYSQHGYKEDRIYKDIHFNKEHFCKINNYIGNNPYKKYIEDIRQEKNSYFKEQINQIIIPNKNSILLVNHDNKLYGANHYMYSLFLFLKDKYKDTINIFLCEINYNSSLYDKYSIKKEDVFEYQHDPTLLYMLYQKIQPKVFYLNSCNYAIYQVYKYIPENRRILHSHEIFTHYLLSKKVMPDYVVSEVISNQYVQLYKKQPKIQPPFISNIDNILELSKEFVEPIYNNYNTLDTTKITIGMCGQITERKNYKLFIEMSLHFSFYNFIWIGDSSPVFDEYKNIYHIKSTHNPYKYFKKIIDHFILFSLEDPCPYVILENILLESNIITFKNNIYYYHTHETLKDMFINYDGSISKKTCVDAIYKYVNCKKKNNKNNGYNYIKTYFNKPSQVEDKMDELLNY